MNDTQVISKSLLSFSILLATLASGHVLASDSDLMDLWSKGKFTIDGASATKVINIDKQHAFGHY